MNLHDYKFKNSTFGVTKIDQYPPSNLAKEDEEDWSFLISVIL